MSGDQAETPLLALEIPAEEIGKPKILQITNPTKITVTANGLQIQSNLNPNATEFFPLYLQKTTPINTEKIDDKINLEPEIAIKEPDNKETKIKDCVGIQDASRNLSNIDTGEQNKNIDDNLEVKIEKHQLCVLYASDSGVKNTSSENVRTTSLPDDKREKHNFDDTTYKANLKDKNIENEIKENDLNSTKKVLLEENIEKLNEIENVILVNINEKCNASPTIKDKVEESIQHCKTTLNDEYNANTEIKDEAKDSIHDDNSEIKDKINDSVEDYKTTLKDDCNANHETQDKTEESVPNSNKILANENEDVKAAGKDNELVYLFCKQNNTETVNIEKSLEAADTKAQSSVNKVNMSKEVKDPKKKMNIISKITRPPIPTTGTAGKMSYSKIPKNVETKKKEIIHKAETKVVQTSSLAKNSKTIPATKTNPPSRLSVQPPKKEVSKIITKDTTANRSACSTEKSASSTKSHPPQNSKVKNAEKPVGHGLKPKESISKSPRATVSSKLRKTETQKRRNLFFDLDTIKMSEFLFK